MDYNGWYDGIALNDLERPVTTWGQVLGSYLYSLRGVSWTGNEGCQGEARAPGSVFHRAERNKSDILYLYATSTSEQQREPAQQANLGRDLPLAHPRNLTIGVVGRTKVTSAYTLLVHDMPCVGHGIVRRVFSRSIFG